MNKVIERPHLIFLVLAPVVLISGLINKGNTFTINIHDTYLVSDIWSVSLYSTVFFFMIALNYYTIVQFAKKKPFPKLTSLHIAFQIIALIPFLYTFYASESYGDTAQKELFLVLAFLLFLLATLIHFINFIASLLRKKE
jgi:heme/copper-type cytochrome/quinol oxidase subunit 1